MNLKYQEEVDKLNCDLSNFTEKENKEAYHWISGDINDPNNFLPHYINNPDRERKKCIGWALSFFSNDKDAKKRYYNIIKDKPKAIKKLGDHLAKGTLTKHDGISNEEGNDSHFSHFEYENTDLKTKFAVVEKLV